MVPLPAPLLPTLHDPRLYSWRGVQLNHLWNPRRLRHSNDHRSEHTNDYRSIRLLRLTDRPHESGSFHRKHTGIADRRTSERLRCLTIVETQRRHLRAGIPLLLLLAFHPVPVRRSVVFCECVGGW